MCRRREQKEKESKRIPKRNVCCDNYFLFWEIATSIGYLQIIKTQNIKTLNKKKSLDLVQLEGGKEKAEEERKRGI